MQRIKSAVPYVQDISNEDLGKPIDDKTDIRSDNKDNLINNNIFCKKDKKYKSKCKKYKKKKKHKKQKRRKLRKCLKNIRSGYLYDNDKILRKTKKILDLYKIEVNPNFNLDFTSKSLSDIASIIYGILNKL